MEKVEECPPGDELCEVRAFESEIIIVPVLLIAASCIVGGCILWMTCRQKKGTPPPDWTETGKHVLELRPSNGALCGQAPSDPELGPWQIPAERLVGGLKLIARGRYGNIFLCRLAAEGSGKEKAVVVKELQESATPGLAEMFLSRIRFQAALGQHPHLVKMEGCSTQGGTTRLVMEALELGNLLHFLWQCRKDVVTMEATPYDLTEKQVYVIAEQVASGLTFQPPGNRYSHNLVNLSPISPRPLPLRRKQPKFTRSPVRARALRTGQDPGDPLLPPPRSPDTLPAEGRPGSGAILRTGPRRSNVTS
ncbi:tyrosine-protein kinase STYK1-like [Hypanus sabinus]|uniref:tyrosine-protein kinase STYK1-like n=1 Tax=Hypanus sabinus TaxID=79690 RepID=UPI0028C4F13E|nr:tyrosine-protein kinase STYK1-like [Hypanus sabinus]